MNRNRAGLILLAVVIVAVAGIATHYFWPRKPTVVADRLCEYVRDQEKMNCVAVLAALLFVTSRTRFRLSVPPCSLMEVTMAVLVKIGAPLNWAEPAMLMS